MAVAVKRSAVDEALDKARAGERIDDADAAALLASRDLVRIGAVANEIRNRLNPPDVVTFVVDRNLNYSNVCYTDCSFCAFYRRPGDTREGYTLPKTVIFKKIEETLALNGTAVLMQGGHNPELGIDWYEDLFTLDQGALPDPPARPLAVRDPAHLAQGQADAVRDALAAARRGARLAARRRRRDPVRPRAQDHLAEEDDLRRVARHHALGPPAGHEHDRHHDVGPRRDARRAGAAPAPHPRAAGRDARLPGVHLVDVPARQHQAARRTCTGRRRASTTC